MPLNLRACLVALAVTAPPLVGQAHHAARAARDTGRGLEIVESPAGNLVLWIGRTETFVAGPQFPDLVRRARAVLESRNAPPVRFVFAAAADGVAKYGDAGWGRRGAITIAHEALRMRMPVRPAADDPDAGGQTRAGFSEVIQLALDGEDVHLVHQHSGSSAADVVAHFEVSNVVYLGEFYTPDGYPAINVPLGGSVDGMIGAVSVFVDGFARNWSMRYVPARGAPQPIDSLRAYREMLVRVRGRVDSLLRAGKSDAEIVAAFPTRDFDARWGSGPITADRFVASVLQSLRKRPTR